MSFLPFLPYRKCSSKKSHKTPGDVEARAAPSHSNCSWENSSVTARRFRMSKQSNRQRSHNPTGWISRKGSHLDVFNQNFPVAKCGKVLQLYRLQRCLLHLSPLLLRAQLPLKEGLQIVSDSFGSSRKPTGFHPHTFRRTQT